MLVKIIKNKEERYYSDVLKVAVNREYCWHKGDKDVTLVRVNKSDDGTLFKNLSYLCHFDEYVEDFDDEDIKRFSSLKDVYTAKVIDIYQKGMVTSLAMYGNTPAFLLNDFGDTVIQL